MKLLLPGLFILLFTQQGYCQQKAGAPSSVIGRTYHDISEVKEFKGYKETGGCVLEPSKDNYCIATVVKGEYKMLLLERCVSKGYGSKVEFTLLDVLNLGRLKQPYDVAYGSCRINTKNDSEVVALVKRENKEYFKKILKAWRANKKTRHFEAIKIKGIDCLDVGYSEVD